MTALVGQPDELGRDLFVDSIRKMPAHPPDFFFGIITRQAIRRGTCTSITDLIDAIRAFIDSWNDRSEPLVGPSRPAR